MPLANAARDHVAGVLIGESLADFNSTSSHLGVGKGTTAFAATPSDLQGACKVRNVMNATCSVTRATNVLKFRGSFGIGDTGFARDAWGIINASSGGELLSSKNSFTRQEVERRGLQVSAHSTFTL
jgi:hypothetical protein